MKKLLSLLLLALALPAFPAGIERITLSIMVSNSPVTSNTLTINATTRTWTNTSSALYIPTNHITRALATTNLANNLAAFPLSPPLAFQWISSTNFLLIGGVGASLSASHVGGAVVLSLSTQSGPATFTAIWPMENMAGGLSNRTNQASSFVSGMGIYSTNAFPTNSTAVSNHLHKGAGPRQRVVSEVEYQTLLAARFAQLTNANLLNSTNSGYTVALTNGIYQQPRLYDPIVTNLTSWGNLYIGDTASGIFNSWAFQQSGGTDLTLYNDDLLSPVLEFNQVGGEIRTWFNGSSLGPPGGTHITTNFGLLYSGSFTTPTGTAGSMSVTTNFATTNSTFRGTNVINGRVDFTSRANASLVNGANSAIVLGSNVFVRLSGATTVAGISGFAAEQDGSYHIVQFSGAITNVIVNEVNSTDIATDATAANRIVTGTGTNYYFTNSPLVLPFIYDATASRWKLSVPR